MIQTNSLELYLKDTMKNWVGSDDVEYFEYIYHDGIAKFGIAGLKKYSPKKDSFEFRLMPFCKSTKVSTVYQLRLDYELSSESLEDIDNESVTNHLKNLFLSRILEDILDIAEIGINTDQFKNGPFEEPEQKMYEVK